MNYKIEIVVIFVILIVGGFILKFKEAYDMDKRRSMVNGFRNNFIDLANQLMQKGYFNAELYSECISRVDEIQTELGVTGLAGYVVDGLRGIQGSNVPILINYLPEIRRYAHELDNYIVRERLLQNIELIDDLLLRHVSCLNGEIERIKGSMLNPFSCFAWAIRCVLSFPFFLLSSFGLLSSVSTTRVYSSLIMRLLGGICSFVMFLSGLITVVIGWDSFSAFLEILFIRVLG